MNFLLELFLASSILSPVTMTDSVSKHNYINMTNNIILEETYTPPYKDERLTDNEDRYEHNEVCQDAVGLCEDDYYLKNYYNTSLDATLDYYGENEDVDYYYFCVYKESEVEIDIYAENSSLFNFYLQNYIYELGNYNTLATQELNNVYLQEGARNRIYYQGILKPGTYFICLRGKQIDYEDIPYTLYLRVSCVETFDNASIKDLRYNKDLSGAIWVSDFTPFGTDFVSILANDIKIYDPTSNSMNYPDYFINDLMEESNGEPILMAKYYFWDPVMIYVLYESICELENVITEIANQNQKLHFELELQQDQLTGTIKLISKGASLIPVNKVIKLSIKATEKVSLYYVNMYFDSLLSSINLNYSDYKEYLSSLKKVFSLNLLENQKNYDYLSTLKVNPIAVPIYYNIYNNGNNHYISFTDTFVKYNELDTLAVNDDTITANPCDCYNVGGKIYGINKINSIQSISDLVTVDNYQDVMRECSNVYLNSALSLPGIQSGDYLWLKFTVPSTDTYHFMCNATGGEHIRIDLFYNQVAGYSNSGLISSHAGGFVNVNVANMKGCYFSTSLTSGTVLYIRIRGNNYEDIPTNTNLPLTFEISDEIFEEIHVHDYKYLSINNTKHSVSCSCGLFQEEFHVVKAGGNRCLLCNGRVSTGIVGPDSLIINETSKFVSCNGSFIRSDGIIVLVDEDVDKFLNGSLKFHEQYDTCFEQI